MATTTTYKAIELTETRKGSTSARCTDCGDWSVATAYIGDTIRLAVWHRGEAHHDFNVHDSQARTEHMAGMRMAWDAALPPVLFDWAQR